MTIISSVEFPPSCRPVVDSVHSKQTFFYPSVNAGFVFTDAFKLNSDILSYGKIRASVARVGADAPLICLLYLFQNRVGNNVASFNFPYGSVAGFGLSSIIAPQTLAPEFTTSYEGGTKPRLLEEQGFYRCGLFQYSQHKPDLQRGYPAFHRFFTTRR